MLKLAFMKMTPEDILKKYYKQGTTAYTYLYLHSQKVTEAAVSIARHNPQYNASLETIRWSAMLHDIGIYLTNAPDIGCIGTFPYIAHGYLGREILENEGLREIAPVCERHIGVGISLADILRYNMPLPHRDMMPVTIEEKIVCYADKFYSKTEQHLQVPKPIQKIRKKILKYGEDKIRLFEKMVQMFGAEYLYE